MQTPRLVSVGTDSRRVFHIGGAADFSEVDLSHAGIGDKIIDQEGTGRLRYVCVCDACHKRFLHFRRVPQLSLCDDCLTGPAQHD